MIQFHETKAGCGFADHRRPQALRAQRDWRHLAQKSGGGARLKRKFKRWNHVIAGVGGHKSPPKSKSCHRKVPDQSSYPTELLGLGGVWGWEGRAVGKRWGPGG